MAPTSPAAPPSSRDKILDVAEQLFARRGYAGVGLQAVADQVGLGKSSLFHHFRSKARLYSEVLGRVLTRIQRRLDPVLGADRRPAQKLERWVEALVDVLAEHPTTARLLMRAMVEDEQVPEDDLADGDAERVLAEILAGIRDLLAAGVADGSFRPVSIPQTVQTLIGATVYHFASGEFGDSVLGRPVLSAAAVAHRKDELVRMLQHGLVSHVARSGPDSGHQEELS